MRIGGSRTKKAADQGRHVQAVVDRIDKKGRPPEPKNPMQAGEREYPSKFPEQHLKKSGSEGELALSPMYEAPGYEGSHKLQDMVALITGGDSGIGRAVAVLFAREGADIAICYLEEGNDAEATRAAVEREGRKCIVIQGDVSDSAVLHRRGRRDYPPVGQAGYSRQQRCIPAAYVRYTGSNGRTLRPDAKDQSLWLFLHGTGRCTSHRAGRINHHDGLGDGARREQGASRLFDDEGRHSCFHPFALGTAY